MVSQRVLDSDVKKILETQLDTQAFIETASLIVTERLSTMGYSTARLTQIELWLAAHFVAIADPRETAVDAAGARATYEHGPLGPGLQSTRYGQQVLALDYLKILAQDSETTRLARIKFH